MEHNAIILLSILLLAVVDVIDTTSPLDPPPFTLKGLTILDLCIRRPLATLLLISCLSQMTTASPTDFISLALAALCYAASRLWGAGAVFIFLCVPALWFLACHCRVRVRIDWDVT